MKKISLLHLIGIFVLCMAIASSLFAEDNLTVQQLIELMKASSNQYTSIDAKMKATSYQKTDGNSQPKIQMVRQITSRWSKDRRYWQIEQTEFGNDATNKPEEEKTVTTYAVSSQWTKRLVEEAGRIPRGSVRAGGVRNEDQTFYTIYWAMWDNCELLSGDTKLHKVSFNYDKANNIYILEIQIVSDKGPLFKFYVDPTKDFIPSRREFFTNDGTLARRFQCEEFRMINNLWIPYRYSWFDPMVNYEVVYEVQEVAVNEPIPDNLLDFEFPEGTIVHDDRIGSTYTIGKASTGQPTVVDPCSQSGQSGAVTVTAPATDDQLRAAAVKAKELLEAHAVKTIVSPAIEVSPGIVLVTVGKSEYKLSIKKYDGTKPVLLSYEFESTELELSSFKNSIDNEDQLTVNINRLQSHTGFAKGILLLQYAGEDRSTKVTFVSAPLPNAP